MNKAILVLFLMIFSYPILIQAGGPWAEGKGKGYVEASFLTPIRANFKDFNFQIYGEVGIIEKLTLKAVLPVKIIGVPDNLDQTFTDSIFDDAKLAGLSNIVLGLKYEILKKKVVMSVGFDAELKTLNKDDETGLRTGFQKYTFRPIYSVGFGIDKLYTYGEIKPGFSTNGFGHEIGLIAEIGGKVDDNVWVSAYFEYRGVLKNGDFNVFDPEIYSKVGFFRDEQNFFTAGAKIAGTLVKGFGINGAVFYGTSVGGSGGGLFSVKAGLYYDW